MELPLGVLDPTEYPYLAAQLGKIRDGRPVHPSTLRSLTDRGFVDYPALTERGEAALEWALARLREDQTERP